MYEEHMAADVQTSWKMLLNQDAAYGTLQ